MKKIRFLVITLVVAAVLMGAAYAAWTDETIINGTVTTGTMDMQIGKVYNHVGGKYVTLTSEIGDDLNSVTAEFKNLYPKTNANLDMFIVNRGSIGVELDNIDFEFIPDEELTEEQKALLNTYLKIDAVVSVGTPDHALSYLTSKHYGADLDLGDNTSVSQFLTKWNNSNILKDVEVAPNEVVRVALRLMLHQNAPQGLQGLSGKFTLKFNWKQHNL